MWAWKKAKYFSYETEQEERSTSNHYSEKLEKTISIKAIKLFTLHTSAHVAPQYNSTQFLTSKNLPEQEKSKHQDWPGLVMLRKQAKRHLPRPNSRSAIQQLLLSRVK